MNKKDFLVLTVVIFLAAAAVICLYGHSLRAPFVFDDSLTIIENPSVKNIKNIRWIWMHDPSRFLTHLSFAVNYHFGRLHVAGYHIVNIALHAFAGVACYIFLRMICFAYFKKLWGEAHAYRLLVFAALIFLCHPIQTQSVTYISQRSNLLASLCYLSALIFYIRYRRTDGVSWYFLSIGASVLGVFTKPIIVTLPLAVVLCEVFLFNAPIFCRKTLMRALPYFLIVAAVPFFLIVWQHKTFDLQYLFDVTRETRKYARWEYLLTQFNVLMTYARLLVFPANQNLDYDYPIAKTFFSYPTIFSFMGLAAAVFFAVRVFKTQRIVSFAIFWIFLTLSLESSIFPISDVIFEHRLYLPMAGCALLFVFYLAKWIRQPSVVLICLFTALGVFSYLTHERNRLWNDKIAFLEDMAKKSPNKPRVHNNLAAAYYKKKDLSKAEEEYKKAIALDKNYAHAHNNLGSVYMEYKDDRQAIEEFNAAIAGDSRYPAPYFNLGNLYRQRGDLEKAETYYQKTLEAAPYFASAYAGLGKIALERGDTASAKSYFLKGIAINPGLAYGHYGLGEVYLSEGQYNKAIVAFERAVEFKPDLVSAYNNIGNLLDIQGKYEDAVGQYYKAISLDRRYANAYYNLSRTLKKMGKPNESQEALKFAMKLFQGDGNAEMAQRTQERLQETPP